MNMANERTYRPEQLAEQLGISGKVVRAYLRKTFTRAESAKGSTWVVTDDQAKIVRKHFLERRGK